MHRWTALVAGLESLHIYFSHPLSDKLQDTFRTCNLAVPDYPYSDISAEMSIPPCGVFFIGIIHNEESIEVSRLSHPRGPICRSSL